MAHENTVKWSSALEKCRFHQFRRISMRKLLSLVLVAAFASVSITAFAKTDCAKLAGQKDHKWTDAEKKDCPKESAAKK
jgi:hypothetical protein